MITINRQTIHECTQQTNFKKIFIKSTFNTIITSYIISFYLFISITAYGQDHLTPDVSELVRPDDFARKLRVVFSEAFLGDVTIRVVAVPSFKTEYVIGIRTTVEAAFGPPIEQEAFVLEPSESIYEVHCREEEEVLLSRRREAGETIPKSEEAKFQERYANVSNDYRKIRLHRTTKVLPTDVANSITEVWRQALLGVKQREGLVWHFDGEIYYFSGRYQREGVMSGNVWSPDPGTKTARLIDLAETLGDYARGKADLQQLKQKLEEAKNP